MCPGCSWDRLYFCSRQEGARPAHRSYSIPTHTIARGRGKELFLGEEVPSGHENVAEGAVRYCLFKGEGMVGGLGVWFLCE